MAEQKTQVTIELDKVETELAVENIFSSMSKKELMTLAVTMIEQWVDEPMSAQRKEHERTVLEKMMKETTS